MGAKNIVRLLNEGLKAGYQFDLGSSDTLKLLPQVDDTGALNIGDGTTDMDVKVFLGASTDFVLFDVGNGRVQVDSAELLMGDSDEIIFGDGSDVTLAWDGTQLEFLPVADDTGAINFGDGTTDCDVKVFLGAATDFVLFDIGNGQVTLDNAELNLGDNDELEFGDASGGDVSIAWDATNLNILPATDDTGAINFGNGTKDMDVKFFLGQSTDFVLFDVGNGQVTFDNAELNLGDSDELEFGDAANGDVTMAWDGTDFDVLAAADDSIIKFGTGTNSFDIWVYGDVAANYVLFDASLSEMTFVSGYRDASVRNVVSVNEDFMASSGATLPKPWATQDTSSGGTPTLNYVDDGVNGTFQLTHDATSEQQNLTLYWGDSQHIDPTKKPIFEARLKIDFAGATFSADQRIVIGLASARNATLDDIVSNLWFRIEGANLNILQEGDDGTTDTDDIDTTIDVVDNTMTVFKIDASNTSAVKFYVDGVQTSTTVNVAALAAANVLQPFIEIQRDAGTEAESVVIDYVRVDWNRS